VERRAWAVSTVAWAWAAALCRAAESTVASTSAWATFCPAEALTAVTLPDTAKVMSAVFAGFRVPDAVTRLAQGPATNAALAPSPAVPLRIRQKGVAARGENNGVA